MSRYEKSDIQKLIEADAKLRKYDLPPPEPPTPDMPEGEGYDGDAPELPHDTDPAGKVTLGKQEKLGDGITREVTYQATTDSFRVTVSKNGRARTGFMDDPSTTLGQLTRELIKQLLDELKKQQQKAEQKREAKRARGQGEGHGDGEGEGEAESDEQIDWVEKLKRDLTGLFTTAGYEHG
jgi:hypothetical protein